MDLRKEYAKLYQLNQQLRKRYVEVTSREPIVATPRANPNSITISLADYDMLNQQNLYLMELLSTL